MYPSKNLPEVVLQPGIRMPTPGDPSLERRERVLFAGGHFLCAICLFPIPICSHNDLPDADKVVQAMIEYIHPKVAKAILDYLVEELDLIYWTNEELLTIIRGEPTVERWVKTKPRLGRDHIVTVRVLASVINRPRVFFNVGLQQVISRRPGIWKAALKAGYIDEELGNYFRCQDKGVNVRQFRLPMFVIPNLPIPPNTRIVDGQLYIGACPEPLGHVGVWAFEQQAAEQAPALTDDTATVEGNEDEDEVRAEEGVN